MRVTFWGAAQTVTGSMHHIEAAGKRFLLDCGLYQGRRRDAFERNSHFPFPVSSIDGVILSHAHIDHSGNLPTLVHNGYSGPIYTTPATIDLCRPMLADSAFLQQKDVEFCNRRREYRRSKGLDDHECDPLYLPEDAEKVNPLFCPVPLGQTKEVAPGFRYRTYEAGHMLGATSMVIEADGVRLAFSGDVGRKHLPILRDPITPDPVDYLIMESTYGDRFHKPVANVASKLAEVVNRTARRGGKIIVPCFAVGRTQQLVMILHQLMDAQEIPSIPIFVDSPLAVNVTEVFRKHPECYDEQTQKFLDDGDDPFGFPGCVISGTSTNRRRSITCMVRSLSCPPPACAKADVFCITCEITSRILAIPSSSPDSRPNSHWAARSSTATAKSLSSASPCHSALKSSRLTN